MKKEQIKVRQQSGWQQLPESWPECARRVLAARGIQSDSDLHYSLDQLPKPAELAGLDTACELLKQAISESWSILIVADYDADGATSCALAIRGLRAMGAEKLDYIVPSRFEHGYGLSPQLVADITRDNQIDLIITVDNGISSIAGVKEAKNNGIKVIVTDHHLPGEVLPEADAIVNPNLATDTFPSKNLAGVGVCFYLLLGLRQSLRAENWFQTKGIAEPNLLKLTDIVALGTVADVVKLDRLNRTLVSQGIARVKKGRACEGIKALIHVAGKEEQNLVSADFGFSVGPRLNAAGRLEDMSLGIELLLTDSRSQAMHYAQQLDSLNAQRRDLQETMQVEALAMLDKLSLDNEDKPLAYCLFHSAWHQGVVGLLASKIKEQHHRPTVVFAPDKDGYIKGSARSIQGVHIRDILAQVDSEQPELISKFGGHAMAAGLTLRADDLASFETKLLSVMRNAIDPAVLNADFVSDGELSNQELSLDMADYLSHLVPWGQGFPEPKFHGEFIIEQLRAVGQQQNHLRLSLKSQGGVSLQAMAFSYLKPDWLQQGCKVTVCYKLSVNTFRDQTQLQLIIDEIIPID